MRDKTCTLNYMKNKASLYSENSKECGQEIFERKFHFMMQNPPENGAVEFNNCRGVLHNGLLSCLADYFNKEGEFEFKPFHTLRITHCQLSPYPYYIGATRFLMQEGTEFVCRLIAKNPNLVEIDLSYTSLEDSEADQLINALKTNTNLQKLTLTGNAISAEKLLTIASKLAENQIKERLYTKITSTLDTTEEEKEILYFSFFGKANPKTGTIMKSNNDNSELSNGL